MFLRRLHIHATVCWAALGLLLAQSFAACAGTMQVPTPEGRVQLFRYPYLQVAEGGRVVILWATTVAGQAKVQIQRDGQAAWTMINAVSTPYAAHRTGLAADFVQHEARIDGLEAGARYRYRVMLGDVTLAKDVPFTTLPSTAGAMVRFVAFGDSGVPYSPQRMVRDALLKGADDGSGSGTGWHYPYDFVVGLGDIAYASGTFVEFERHLFAPLSGKADKGDGRFGLLSRRPFVPVLGNHEYANDAKSEPVGFVESFSNPVPSDLPEGQRDRYYSFDAGPAHFVVLDSMKFHGALAEQRDMLAWLDRDLARTKAKWRLVFLHHAPYSHGAHGTYGDIPINRRMRAELAPLLQKHSVQLVLNGHDHLYERTKRLTVDERGRLRRVKHCELEDTSRGVVYVTVGIGGGDLHNRALNNLNCGSPEFHQSLRQYGEGYDFAAIDPSGRAVIRDLGERSGEPGAQRYGFLHVEITGDAIKGRAVTYQGVLLDEFELR